MCLDIKILDVEVNGFSAIFSMLMSPKKIALLRALFVSFLWSTSWIFYKSGLESIPPLFFAGTRYFIAFLILVVYFQSKGKLESLKKLDKQDWLSIIGFGFLFIFITHGLLILTLDRLSTVSTSMIVNFSSLFIAILGVALLKEKLKIVQWAGIAIFLLGVIVFFTPISIPRGSIQGLIFAGMVMLFNSFSSILARFINRSKRVDPLTVTVVSMGAGSSLLLLTGLLVDPIPSLKAPQVAIILWLAAVNTAFAFVIWNGAMQILKASEWSMVNNTMLIQIAILAWVFLGETPSGTDWLGMTISLAGIYLVTGADQLGGILSRLLETPRLWSDYGYRK